MSSRPSPRPSTPVKQCPPSPRWRHRSASPRPLSNFLSRLPLESPTSPSPRRRMRSFSPRPLPAFLAKLPLEESPRAASPEEHKKGDGLTRSNSFTKLFQSKKSDQRKHENWGHESTSTVATFNSSFSGAEESEWAIKSFLKEIDSVIDQQTKRLKTEEERIAELQNLASARYLNGSHMGAVLSLRKAHQSLTMVGHLNHAIEHIQVIRNRLASELSFVNSWSTSALGCSNSSLDLNCNPQQINIADQRRAMVLILAKLKKLGKAVSVVPDDETLLEQMLESMDMAEI